MASIVARVYRNQMVESVHYGDWVIVDHEGRIIAWQGDPHLRTFIRSAAKPIQAVPIVTEGAADRFRLTDSELAVICSSHSGEPEHLAAVSSILAKIGLDHKALRCGVHPPRDPQQQQLLIRTGAEPNELHNNCSGKHAGMLALCVHKGWDLNTYTDPGHPLQQMILSYISEFCGASADTISLGIDGCGVPVFGLALVEMALAWARLADPSRFSPQWAVAVEWITLSMRRHPNLVAGSNRLCTDLMRAFRPCGLVAKAGAEAVYCIALPDRGWGLALKIADGSSRAIAPVVLAILSRLGYSGDRKILSQYQPAVIYNHHRQPVGEIVPDLSEAIFERVVHQ